MDKIDELFLDYFIIAKSCGFNTLGEVKENLTTRKQYYLDEGISTDILNIICDICEGKEKQSLDEFLVEHKVSGKHI